MQTSEKEYSKWKSTIPDTSFNKYFKSTLQLGGGCDPLGNEFDSWEGKFDSLKGGFDFWTVDLAQIVIFTLWILKPMLQTVEFTPQMVKSFRQGGAAI